MTDWEIFRQALFAILNGSNPYLAGSGEYRLFNPPWALLPILPIAILPTYVGLLLNALISLSIIFLVSRKLKLTKWEFFLLAISPMHIQSMVYGNIEWMPLAGLLAPAPIALLLFTTKPQSAIGWILILLVETWEQGKWKALSVIILPTLVFSFLTLFMWGLPPTPGALNPGQHSLFPYSLILGLPALGYSLYMRDKRLAGFVGPFISPYVTFHGYLPALLPFRRWWLAICVVLAYVPVVLGIVA